MFRTIENFPKAVCLGVKHVARGNRFCRWANSLDSLDGASDRETIVSYEPFVIKTEDEITMAFRDYRNGAMGLVP